jgi:hypothetical protein
LKCNQIERFDVAAENWATAVAAARCGGWGCWEAWAVMFTLRWAAKCGLFQFSSDFAPKHSLLFMSHAQKQTAKLVLVKGQKPSNFLLLGQG